MTLEPLEVLDPLVLLEAMAYLVLMDRGEHLVSMVWQDRKERLEQRVQLVHRVCEDFQVTQEPQGLLECRVQLVPLDPEGLMEVLVHRE